MVNNPEIHAGDTETLSSPVSEGVVIVDFGSQYSHLISRRARELKVYSEVVFSSTPWEKVTERITPRGVILSGGPASVYDSGAPRIPDWVMDHQLPVLGICYGMQAMVHQLGGQVAPGDVREYGSASVAQPPEKLDDNPLLHGLPAEFQVWMSHGDRVESLPRGFRFHRQFSQFPLCRHRERRRLVWPSIPSGG